MAGTNKSSPLGRSGNNKKQRPFFQQPDNPIEIIKDLTAGLAQSGASDVFGGIGNSALEQIGLKPAKKIQGTLSPNEDINLEALNVQKEEEFYAKWLEKRPVIKSPEQPVFKSEDFLVQRKIQEILVELKTLAKSVEKVSQETGKVAMEEMPVRPGIYHLNFFEKLLKLIKDARSKVEESSVCLKLFQSRKQQKQYWTMFKKHGTTFGLSQERVVATQTG